MSRTEGGGDKEELAETKQQRSNICTSICSQGSNTERFDGKSNEMLRKCVTSFAVTPSETK